MFPNLSSLVQQVPQGRKNKTNPYGVLRAGAPIIPWGLIPRFRPRSPLRRLGALCSKKTSRLNRQFFNTKAAKEAAMFAKEPPNSYTPSL